MSGISNRGRSGPNGMMSRPGPARFRLNSAYVEARINANVFNRGFDVGEGELDRCSLTRALLILSVPPQRVTILRTEANPRP